jgi:hypothetical protein
LLVWKCRPHNTQTLNPPDSGPAGESHADAVLPFAGLSHPEGVAVDAPGSVYVADTNNNRVLKLPVQWRGRSDRVHVDLPVAGLLHPLAPAPASYDGAVIGA